MGKRTYVFSAVWVMVLLIIAACGGGTSASQDDSGETEKETAQPIELKLGTKMPESTPEGEAFQYFADLVKEKSGGELLVQVYPAEQLGKGTTQIDNMILGTQDMYAEGITYFQDYDSRTELSSVPFLFRDFEHYQKFNTGEIGLDIQETLIENGMRILNTERNFVRGPYRVLLSTRPVKSVDDLQGLKVRAPESAIYVDAYKHLGANPTVVAWTETYLALKQKVVEAVTSPISLVWGMKFSEVAPHVTIIDEHPQDVVIVMSEKSFQNLSEEHQQILIDAANEAGEKATELVEEAAERDLERMKEEHGIQVYDINREEWEKKMEPFFEELDESGQFPEGTIEQVRNIR